MSKTDMICDIEETFVFNHFNIHLDNLLHLCSHGLLARHNKTCFPGFRLGPTRTGLYNHRGWLET